MNGDSIETTLEMLERNGAFPDDLPPENTEPVTRWQFPRFKGATEDGDMYLSRVGVGPFDTDVETVIGWLEAPRNIVGATLLLSDPGTGKTALIEAAATHMERELTTVLCTPDHTKDSLLYRFVGEGNGDVIGKSKKGETPRRSPFTLGPVAHAAKHGHLLYMDEFMLLVDGVKPLLYSLADGRHMLPEGNVDGSALEIHKDFRLILSSNPQVRGASLPEPLASRAAGSTLHVETDAALLHDLGIDEALIEAWEALRLADLWFPQVRELRAASYWLDLSPEMAASALIPEHCPDSQRQAVRNTVLATLGASLPGDGRLVVR